MHGLFIGARLLAVCEWRVCSAYDFNPDGASIHEVSLGGLIVAKAQRKKGLGGRLIARCLALSSGVAVSEYRLLVNCPVLKPNTPARRLYRRFGFDDQNARRQALCKDDYVATGIRYRVCEMVRPGSAKQPVIES
ncbi:GNAT family N-acetyltransferase [Acidovorax sp. NPDC077693]|uniref:GNAT family N-acetyltransferase n=1 Tax=unclassified Acidovorax TaxID=2684926 RepID=UPI0037C51F6D